MRLRLLALALLAGAALAAQTTPARAAATGPLAVHVEGSLGAPTLEQPPVTLWPFRAVETLRGIVDGSSDTDGTLAAFETGDPDRPLQVGSLWSGDVDVGGRSERAAFVCAVTEFGERGEPLGGPCAVTGALTGRGTFQITELEFRPDATLAWELDFPSVFCRLCRPR
jgi:hypothetical protein